MKDIKVHAVQDGDEIREVFLDKLNAHECAEDMFTEGENIKVVSYLLKEIDNA